MASSLEQLEARHPVTVRWRAFELRPAGTPISPDYRARIEESRPRLYAIAREQYGLEMNPGPFGIDSRPALIGHKYAESQGKGAAYHDRVMRAYWQEAQDIGQPDVLTELAREVGLDATAFLQALTDPVYQQAVDEDIAQAQAYGLTAVPALVFAEKYLVSGAQPLYLLEKVVRHVAAELAAEESGPS
ncbi:MAG: hypothetical protein KatS3mg050_2070 [Litorilinea sp.]|nr:MAG: hypothetical protein KatS3mg050_2070 [Litorilinea sp.]